MWVISGEHASVFGLGMCPDCSVFGNADIDYLDKDHLFDPTEEDFNFQSLLPLLHENKRESQKLYTFTFDSACDSLHSCCFA